MTAMASPNHLAAFHVQSSEQRSGSVANIIMAAAFHLPGTHGQQRLRAIQRLDLRLLVYAQHQRAVRWVQTKPHNIAHLVDEQRIARQFEAFAAVRQQGESTPDTADRRLAEPLTSAIE